MKRFIFSIFILSFATAQHAQKATDATRLFDEGRYAEAAEANRLLLKKKPNDGLFNFRLARCLMELGQQTEAIEHLQTAADNGFAKAYRYLGDIRFDNYFFAEAAEAYAHWLDEGDIDEATRAYYTERLRQANLGAQLLQRIEDIALIDSTIAAKTDFLTHLTIPRETGAFFASSDGLAGFEAGRNDRRYLTLAENGQTDLYLCNNLMGEWSAPQPLSATLNSDRNENYPFVAADGITIYFGSEGHDGLGGYDIFMSRYNSERNDYMPPQNVGMPFNSTGNDYMMAFDELAGIGWFVTDRFRADDSVAIYRFKPNAQRLILRGKTDDELRTAAKMQSFRHADVPQEPAFADELRQRTAHWRFVVNDTTVYTAASDFKSDEAHADFDRLQTLQLQIAQKRFTLQAKRELWQITDEAHERAALANDILATEKAIPRLEKQAEACEKRIRQAENEALKRETRTITI